MTHTPGPWLAHFSPNTGWSVWHDPRQHGDMRTGAIIVAGEVGPQATSYKTHRERKANALLIAAAPDMLGELTRTFDLLQMLSAYVPAHGAKMLEEYQARAVTIRNVITKATTPTDSNIKEEST